MTRVRGARHRAETHHDSCLALDRVDLGAQGGDAVGRDVQVVAACAHVGAMVGRLAFDAVDLGP
jgi:hypothetical protein